MFLFPVGDPKGVRYRSLPFATLTIIFINVAVYLFELLATYPDGYVGAVRTLGMAPLTVRTQTDLAALTAFTSMFLHARSQLALHLIGNMVVLWTFGRRVEDACGPLRFVMFYFTAGLCANLLQILSSDPGSDIPAIGASGAVAGVMGAYLVLFPGTRIRAIFWVVIPIPYPFQMRAFWFIIPWLVLQLLPSIDILQGAEYYSVAYFAHLGGFLGALLIFLFLRKDALYRYVAGIDL